VALTSSLPAGLINDENASYVVNDDNEGLVFYVYFRDRLSTAPGFLLHYETSMFVQYSKVFLTGRLCNG